MKYILPLRGLKSFTCPHCGVMARHYSYSQTKTFNSRHGSNYASDELVATTVCECCNDLTLWVNDKMVHPNRGSAPLPILEMPDDVKEDYEEAASIAITSPKAAAALLRLAVQKLCVHLGGKGKNINDDIARLVEEGLPVKIQQSLDVLRVVGNNAVHPGQINTDSSDVVEPLFGLLNIIVEDRITNPEKVRSLFSNLPDGALAQIEERDGGSGSVDDNSTD